MNQSPRLSLGKMKFEIPERREQSVNRPRCMDRLRERGPYSFVHVVAPFGYGKTTLLAEMAHACKEQAAVGWLTLDETDNDPSVFLSSLIRAIPHLDTAHKANQTALASSPVHEQSQAIEALIEQLVANGSNVCLFIDQYECITNPAIHDCVFRISRASACRFTLCIASRTKLPFIDELERLHPPPVGLSAPLLAFNRAEMKACIKNKTAKPVPPSDLLRLEKLTQGWPLAVAHYAHLIHEEDPDEFGRKEPFAALQQEIHERFMSRVFSACSPELQELMLAASVPPFFHKDPVASISEHPDPMKAIVLLHAMNLFVTREVDGTSTFHPMIRTCLNQHFKQQDEEKFRKVHLICSEWFQQQGANLQAVQLATAVQDYARAINILMNNLLQLFHYPLPAVIAAAERIPFEEIVKKPAAAMAVAWFFIAIHRLSAGEKLLNQTELYLHEENDVFPPTGEKISGYIALLRSKISFLRRETEAGLTYMKQGRSILGDVAYLFRHSNTLDKRAASLLKSVIGHWGAIDQCLAMCEFAESTWGGINQGYGIMTILLGECYLERNQIKKAEAYLIEARKIGLDLQDVGLILPSSVALIQCKLALQQNQAAHILMEEVKQLIIDANHLDSLRTLETCQALVAMREGRTEPVKRWLQSVAPSHSAALDPQFIYDDVIRLKAYLYLNMRKEGIRFGEQLLQLAQTRYIQYFTASIHLLLAALYKKIEDETTALYHLEKSLEIGAIEGYVRLYLEEWELVELFKPRMELQLQLRKPAFSRDVVHFYKALRNERLDTELQTDKMAYAKHKLSKKEALVLLLLREGQSNAWIAENMRVSLETVKSHCKSIYKKLSLKGRKDVLVYFSDK